MTPTPPRQSALPAAKLGATADLAARAAKPLGGVSESFEFVAAPVILALLGLWLDRSVFDTTPIFTVGFAVLGVVGATVKLYYGYRHRMALLAERSPWAGGDRTATEEES